MPAFRKNPSWPQLLGRQNRHPPSDKAPKKSFWVWEPPNFYPQNPPPPKPRQYQCFCVGAGGWQKKKEGDLKLLRKKAFDLLISIKLKPLKTAVSSCLKKMPRNPVFSRYDPKNKSRLWKGWKILIEKYATEKLTCCTWNMQSSPGEGDSEA